jgi:uncharacterized protein DUF2630
VPWRKINVMDDEILRQINALVDEEHHLERKASPGQPLSDDDEARLRQLEVRLDQCWDLLRQRRARREAGLDPGFTGVRPADIVEGYH